MEENQSAGLDIMISDDEFHWTDAQGMLFRCNSPGASPASLDRLCFNSFADDILNRDPLDALHTINGDDDGLMLQGDLQNPSAESLSLPPLTTNYSASSEHAVDDAANVGSSFSSTAPMASPYAPPNALPAPAPHSDEPEFEPQDESPVHLDSSFADPPVDDVEVNHFNDNFVDEDLFPFESLNESASFGEFEPSVDYAYSHQMSTEPNTSSNIPAFQATTRLFANPPSPPLYMQPEVALPMEEKRESEHVATATNNTLPLVSFPPPAPFISAPATYPHSSPQYAMMQPTVNYHNNDEDYNYRRSVFHDNPQLVQDGNPFGHGYYAPPPHGPGLTSPSISYPALLSSPMHAPPVVNSFNTFNVFVNNPFVEFEGDRAMITDSNSTTNEFHHNYHTMNHNALAASAYVTTINFVDTNNSKQEEVQRADLAEEEQSEDEDVAERQVEDEKEKEEEDDDEEFVVKCSPSTAPKSRRAKSTKKRAKSGKSKSKSNPRKRSRKAMKEEADECSDAVEIKTELELSLEAGPVAKKQKLNVGNVGDYIKETKTNRECKRMFDQFVANGEVIVDEASKTFGCRVEGCDKNYASKPHLRRHIDEHLDRRFVCTLCNRDFAQKTQAREHINNQHFEAKQQWECQYCGQAYTRYGGVKRHLVLKRCSYLKSLPRAEQQTIIDDANADKLKDQMKR